jgi:peptidyl-dipeptidase Dcp
MDLAFHTADPTSLDPKAFEAAELGRLGMPTELVMRHRTPHFAHVFSGEGYATGYYGYMWADVLTADAAEAFAEAEGGFFDAEVAERLVTNLFAPGNSIDPTVAYRSFRGRDARIDALMRDRGFAAGPGGGGD